MAENFLWRKVSEEEKKEIKKEAKEIIDRFADALKKADREISETGLVRRKKETRNETAAKCDPEFRKIFLKNAPKTEKDERGEWISAEKGAWK